MTMPTRTASPTVTVAATDPPTEAAICATLEALKDSLAILAISHQPKIIEVSDLVYRIEAGTITLADKPATSLEAAGTSV